ncbi:MAG: hypothetical protein AABY15_00730 [Nanoarchaeota archaeon]
MNKKAAIEMSMTTFVTIVLVVIVMVLGIFFVQRIFQSSTNAIDSIDSQVQSEINKLFAGEGTLLSVYPSSRQVTFKTGDTNKGFAFSVKNDVNERKDFTYAIGVDPNFDFTRCGSAFTKTMANSWLVVDTGSFTLGRAGTSDSPELVLLTIPKTSPACTIPYKLEVKREGSFYVGTTIYIITKQ